VSDLPTHVAQFHQEVTDRLEKLTTLATTGGLDEAIGLLTTCIAEGGVIHAFGTGHSEAFAMEIAGRAGGLIPTNKVALRDAAILGGHALAELTGEPPLERDPNIAQDVFATVTRDPRDVFVIASNSGVNGSIVGLALLAKEHGHPVVAVTSLAHTLAVEPKHPSGKRLADLADVVIDNLAPYGDATLSDVAPVTVGAVSSLTAAYIAQLLTVGTVTALEAKGVEAPLYVSANVPGGHDRNLAIEARYAGRIRRSA